MPHLFDDILKRSNPTPPADPLAGGTTGSQPQQQGSSSASAGGNPQIVKTDSEMFFGPGKEGNIVQPLINPEATVHAEESDDMIIMDTTTPPITPVPTVKTNTPQASINTPEPTETILSPTSPESSSQILSQDIIIQADPMATAGTESQAPVNIPESSIFAGIMSETATTPPSSVSIPEPEAVPEPPQTTSQISAETGNTSEEGVGASAGATGSNPGDTQFDISTPRAFIEKSLADISIMLRNIDKKIADKAGEEESYKNEKLRFAHLEKQAHAEGVLMQKERVHGLRMEQILRSELKQDEANRQNPSHVEDTLAMIEEEHPRAEKQHSHKKHHNIENEVLAGA